MTRWPMLRILLSAHLIAALALWLGLLVLSALITTGVATFGHVNGSIWHQVATQGPRWIAFGLGVSAITTYLRLHIAHGRTRRDFLRQLWPYILGLATALALLVALGYLIERGVYAVAGWSNELPFPAIFDTTGEFFGILGSFTLVLLLWAVVGVAMAAAFSRKILLGLLTVPFGLLLVAPTDLVLGIEGIPVARDLLEYLDLPTLASAGLCAIGALAAGAVAWGFVRDIPLRPRLA
jgi:hypothetical protein